MSNRHAELVAALHGCPPHDDRNPDKRTIQCPAAGHPDTDPSARYSIEADGTVLLYCWSRNCSFEDMLDGLGGFEPRDAFPPDSQRPNGHAPSLPKPRTEKPPPLPEPHHWDRTASWQARYAAHPDVPGSEHTRGEARNADGTPVMRGAKVRKRVIWPTGTVVNDLALYRSWELPADGLVVVTEGEKAADAVIAAGFPAVGTYGTSYTPSTAALEPLRGRDVGLWADADPDGRKHMAAMARLLAGIASSVRTVSPMGDVPTGWDAADTDAATIAELVTHVTDAHSVKGLAAILDRLDAHLRRFVWFPKPEQATAVVLWIAHCHAVGAVEQSPILLIKSPVKQSGKSRLLDVIATVVPKPWRIERPSEAVLYRRIERDQPTILMDEADTIFEDRKGQYEGIRAIFNAGNRRGTVVSRAIAKGKGFELVDFEIYCPKAVAGLGRFPETMVDRSVVIAMTRRGAGEHVERLRARQAEQLGAPIRDGLMTALSVITDLTLEDLPDELDDRGQDNWESLLALANAAGGRWPEQARTAATVLNADRQAADDNAGITLLTDLRAVYAGVSATAYQTTTELLEQLHAMDTSPWAEWRGGKPLTGRGMARILRDFEITPDRTRASRGYSRSQFADAWNRYLPPLPAANPSQASQPPTDIADEYSPSAFWDTDAPAAAA